MEHRGHAEDHVVGREANGIRRLRRRAQQVGMAQRHTLGLAHGPRRVEDREGVLLRIHLHRLERTPFTAGQDVLELVDAVVVPEVRRADRHQVLQLRQRGQETLEQLEIVDPVEILRRHHDGRLRVPEHVLQLAGTV